MNIFQIEQTHIEVGAIDGYQMMAVYRQGVAVGSCCCDKAGYGDNPDRMVWTAAIGFDISPSLDSAIKMLHWCDGIFGHETIGVF